MGQAKKEMTRIEELEAIALSILERTGAVTECPDHEGVYLDNNDEDGREQAFAIGTNMAGRREIDASQQEIRDAIKRAIVESAIECGYCEKNAAD